MNLETNIDKTKNTQLIKTKNIPNTPFTIVNQDEKYFLSLGNYQLTNKMETELEVEEYLNNNVWDVFIKLTLILIEKKNELDKNFFNNKNQKQ